MALPVTIGANFTFAAAGTEDTLYGFSYSTVKSGAFESAETDAFLLGAPTNGNLYYNIGSTTVPKYKIISSFSTTNGGAQLRITGLFIDNVKVTVSDAKVYWMPETAVGTTNTDGSVLAFGAATNANGVTAAFTIKAVDNGADATFQAGFSPTAGIDDTFSADTATVSINLTPVNDAPTISGPAAVATTFAENSTGTIATVVVVDPDVGDTKTFTLSGVDAAKFLISAAGALSFNPATNFEAPTDTGTDGVYNVIVKATDSGGLSASVSYAVTVTNVNEAPVNTVPGTTSAGSSNAVLFDGLIGNGHAAVISIADPDNAVTATTQNLSVDLLLNGTSAASDTLSLTAGAATVTGSGTNHVVVSGTQAAINAALATLSFNGITGFGSDNIKIVTTDVLTGTLAGGLFATSNIGVAAGNPMVSSVTPPLGAHYNNLTNLTFDVTFDQAVVTTGTPVLGLTVGGSPVTATLTGNVGTTLTFTYDIAPADSGAVVIGAITGGTVKNAGGASADLTLNNVGSTAALIVDNTADAGAVATVIINDGGDGYLNNSEKAAVSYTLSGVDADAKAVVTFHSTGGGTDIVVSNLVNGAQSVDLSSLKDGTITAAIQVTDTSISTNTAAGTGSSTVKDVVIATPTATLTTDTGSSSSDGITKDASVSFSSTPADLAVAGRTFSVDGGAASASYVAPTVDGTHTVTVTDSDKAGNTATSTTLSFTLDTTIATPTAVLANDTGSSSSDRLTKDASVTFSSAPADLASRTFSVDGAAASATYTAPTADGSHTVTVTDTDKAGNTATSAFLTFTLDKTIATPTATLTTDTGSSSSDGITQNAGVTFSNTPADLATRTFSVDGGTASASYTAPTVDGTHTVTVTDTDKAGNTATSATLSFTLDKTIATPTAVLTADTGSSSSDGITKNAGVTFSTAPSDLATLGRTFSVDGAAASATYTAPTADGSHTVTVTDTDKAGNTATSATLSFTLDTTIATPTATLTNDTGSSGSDGLTKDASVSFSSTPADLATRTFSVDGGTASASYTAPTVDGTHTVTVTDTDKAGNTATSTTLTFTLDKTIATPTAVLTADTGSSSSDGITKDASVTFSSAPSDLAVAGRTFSIDGGTASASYTAPTAQGAHTVTVTDTDKAGNTATSATLSFTLDTVIATPTAVLTNDAGFSKVDGLTNDASVTFSLTPTDLAPLGRTFSVDKGTASASYTAPTADGTHTVTVTDTDKAGNTATSSTLSFTLDTTLTQPTVALTSDTGYSSTDLITQSAGLKFSTPDLDNYSRTFKVDTGTAGASYTAPTADGAHTVTVTDTDNAGNTKNASITFTLDTTIATPTASLKNDTGVSNSDGLTKDGTLTLSTAPSDNYTRTFSDFGGAATTKYSLVEGAHSIVVTDTDKAGNPASSAAVVFTTDTIAPTTTFNSALYNAGNHTLTLTGTNVDTLLNGSQSAATDIKAQLDVTKLVWNTDGSGMLDHAATAGAISSAFAVDSHTLKIVLGTTFAAAIEGDTHFGTAAGSAFDKVVISTGFTQDAAGNLSAGDAVTTAALGDLNQTGLPSVYTVNLSVPAGSADVVNETLGASLQGTYVDSFNAAADTIHIAGTTAAQVDVYGSAISPVGGLGAYVAITNIAEKDTVVLNGWDAGTGIRNSNVLSFDDGSVLRTNATAISATLSGGTHDDLLIAGSGGDRLAGGAGNDRLIGGAGNDQIYGGSGNDTIYGGGGNNYLVGGSGLDHFLFSGNAGSHDTIADFYAGVAATPGTPGYNDPISGTYVAGTPGSPAVPGDTIEVSANDFNSGLMHFYQSGSDTLITFDSGSTIRVLGASPSGVQSAIVTHQPGEVYAAGVDVFAGHGLALI